MRFLCIVFLFCSFILFVFFSTISTNTTMSPPSYSPSSLPSCRASSTQFRAEIVTYSAQWRQNSACQETKKKPGHRLPLLSGRRHFFFFCTTLFCSHISFLISLFVCLIMAHWRHVLALVVSSVEGNASLLFASSSFLNVANSEASKGTMSYQCM